MDKPKISRDKTPDVIKINVSGSVEALNDIQNIAALNLGDDVALKLEAVIDKRAFSEDRTGDTVLTITCRVSEILSQEEVSYGISGAAASPDDGFDD